MKEDNALGASQDERRSRPLRWRKAPFVVTYFTRLEAGSPETDDADETEVTETGERKTFRRRYREAWHRFFDNVATIDNGEQSEGSYERSHEIKDTDGPVAVLASAQDDSDDTDEPVDMQESQESMDQAPVVTTPALTQPRPLMTLDEMLARDETADQQEVDVPATDEVPGAPTHGFKGELQVLHDDEADTAVPATKVPASDPYKMPTLKPFEPFIPDYPKLGVLPKAPELEDADHRPESIKPDTETVLPAPAQDVQSDEPEVTLLNDEDTDTTPEAPVVPFEALEFTGQATADKKVRREIRRLERQVREGEMAAARLRELSRQYQTPLTPEQTQVADQEVSEFEPTVAAPEDLAQAAEQHTAELERQVDEFAAQLDGTAQARPNDATAPVVKPEPRSYLNPFGRETPVAPADAKIPELNPSRAIPMPEAPPARKGIQPLTTEDNSYTEAAYERRSEAPDNAAQPRTMTPPAPLYTPPTQPTSVPTQVGAILQQSPLFTNRYSQPVVQPVSEPYNQLPTASYQAPYVPDRDRYRRAIVTGFWAAMIIIAGFAVYMVVR